MSVARPNSIAGFAGQLVFFAILLVVLMYISTSPPYKHFSGDKALLKLSIRHAGQIKGKCHKPSEQELAKLSPNMRVSKICPRERSEVLLELELDGKFIYQDRLQPSGVKRDGVANVYRRFLVPPGQHKLVVRMKDHIELSEYNYVNQVEVNLAPAQIFVIDFETETGGFIFR